MSGSPGCPAFWFARATLPSDIFGVHDVELAENARRRRFLLRRRDPEFLEVFSSLRVCAAPVGDGVVGGDGAAVAVVEPVVSDVGAAGVGVRRSRRVLGIDAEYDEILRSSRRQRLS